jgi:hypothetical protein
MGRYRHHRDRWRARAIEGAADSSGEGPRKAGNVLIECEASSSEKGAVTISEEPK